MRHYHTFLVAALAAGLSFVACRRDTARLDGRFAGCENRKVYLEAVSPDGGRTIDSTITDERGAFRFEVRTGEGRTAFYNLRSGESFIPLIVAPGERISVWSVGDLQRNYRVEGSHESALLCELGELFSIGTARLDSIGALLVDAGDRAREAITRAYAEEYYRIKREQIRFIVTHPGSLAAVYALYQRLPGETTLAGGESDIVYLRLVADSAAKRYPGSPYVRALENEIEAYDNRQELLRRIEEGMKEAKSYPDLDLPDIYGTSRRLSEQEGKVVLVDFWSASAPDAALLNAELRQVWEKYHRDGFEVYQIAVDNNRSTWVNAVLDQRLPWICVSDLQGIRSPALTYYNVRRLPANFLIDRKGNIVAKNLSGDALANKVHALLEES